MRPVFDAYPLMPFDGELYNHDHKDNFNKLIRMVRKVDLDADLKREVETTLQYHIYDVALPEFSFRQRAGQRGHPPPGARPM